MRQARSIRDRRSGLRRKPGVLAAALLAVIGIGFGVAARSAARPGDPRDLSDLTTKIEDMQASVQVTKLDSKELEKIGKDFGVTYRIRNLILQYKQPDKLRLTGRIPVLGEAVLIMNGAMRYYHVPKLEKKVEDLEKSPGKRLSLLEYSGVLSPNTLSYMQGRFVREEMQDGRAALVYDMTYQGQEAGSHYRLWIDPDTRITRKREWYDRENRLRATFFYCDPQEVADGIWLPSRVEVRNAEGVTAAATTIRNVQINQGLSDDLFAIHP
ncbi:MAG TPA: outer membrane lipoprotein-sorting protein [Chthonomonadaceae bacterium]|nr:outer membrane lipoprotein-sorting protein [Chthonomonadaceae bacterium]